MSSIYCGQHGIAQRRRSVTALKGHVIYREQHGDDAVSQLFRVVQRRCSVTALQGHVVYREQHGDNAVSQLLRVASSTMRTLPHSGTEMGE